MLFMVLCHVSLQLRYKLNLPYLLYQCCLPLALFYRFVVGTVLPPLLPTVFVVSVSEIMASKQKMDLITFLLLFLAYRSVSRAKDCYEEESHALIQGVFSWQAK